MSIIRRKCAIATYTSMGKHVGAILIKPEDSYVNCSYHTGERLGKLHSILDCTVSGI